jgi:HTH-type transcriptional regulator/antitoxin HigA
MATTLSDPSGRADVSDVYLDLIRRFPLRPIRTDDELAAANRVLDLLLARDELSADETDYLDVLGGLMERYEDEAHPLPPITDVDMLRYLIESRDVTQAKVAAGTGIVEPTISAILSGKRGLNRNHITALARFFQVSPAVFLNE